MRISTLAAIFGLSASACAGESAPGAEALINAAIADIDSHRAMMTRVSIPAGLTLPRHYHPTEEYLYVAKGSTILRIEGEADRVLNMGMAARIPAKAVHTALTKDSEAEVIVFRIHPNGQPVRIPVKDTNHD